SQPTPKKIATVRHSRTVPSRVVQAAAPQPAGSAVYPGEPLLSAGIQAPASTLGPGLSGLASQHGLFGPAFSSSTQQPAIMQPGSLMPSTPPAFLPPGSSPGREHAVGSEPMFNPSPASPALASPARPTATSKKPLSLNPRPQAAMRGARAAAQSTAANTHGA